MPAELWELVVSMLPVEPVSFAVSTLAGVPTRNGHFDGPADEAMFFVPTGVAVDAASGLVYVADSNNHRIRRIDRGCGAGGATVATVAGSADWGFRDGPALDALFQNPMGVAVDDEGGVLVADTENHAVRRLSPAGLVSTLTGAELEPPHGLSRPAGLTVAPNGDVLIADTLHHRVARLSRPDDVLSTVAQAKRWEQEPQLGASFGMPTSVAVLPTGRYIVAAGATNRLWEVSAEGAITKVVGDGPGMLYDVCRHFCDGPGATAKFWHPCGVCVDGRGNVVVADTNNNCVRLVRPSRGWECTRIAGDVQRGFADGAADAARFFRPVGLTLDVDGSVLVADTDNHVIRRVRPTEFAFAA